MFYNGQQVIVNSPWHCNRLATVVCRSLGNASEWMVALEPDGDLDFVAEAEMQPAEEPILQKGGVR